MSLRKVDEIATEKLMTLFYEYYTESGDARRSLAKAQKNNPAPYYRAAFVIRGGAQK